MSLDTDIYTDNRNAEVSVCCGAEYEETERTNPYDHHDLIPTCTCKECGQECDIIHAI